MRELLCSHWIYSLSKQFPHEFMVSVTSFIPSTVHHDVQFVNYGINRGGCFTLVFSAYSDMGWGIGHYCKSVGKTLPVWTQHSPERSPPHAPYLLLCGRKHMVRLPTIIFWCDRCYYKLGEWKTTLWLQQQRLHKSLWPLHTGLSVHLYCAEMYSWRACVGFFFLFVVKRFKVLTMFYIRSALFKVTLSSSPGRVGAQLQGRVCSPAVPKWYQGNWLCW